MFDVIKFDFWILPIAAFLMLVVSTIIFLASRYKRCPSDKILVVYGKVGEGQSANCIHGGGAFIWPLIQDYAYISLTPMTISIPLQKALSMQNIRINVPSTFTVGISTDPSHFPDILHLADFTTLLHTGNVLGNSYYPVEKQWIAEFPTDLSTSNQHLLWRTENRIQAPVGTCCATR